MVGVEIHFRAEIVRNALGIDLKANKTNEFSNSQK